MKKLQLTLERKGLALAIARASQPLQKMLKCAALIEERSLKAFISHGYLSRHGRKI
jgi:hypothetical protein